jgi:uncharacterized iron-regulated membrane protein
MQIRPAVLKIHRWLALAAMVPLILLGLTGAVLTFENELDHTLNPTLWSVAPGGQRLEWQAVLDGVRRKYPSDRVVALRLPTQETLSAEVSLASGLLVYCDPHDGAVRGARRRPEILMARIHQFHTNLLVGEYGSRVMGISALVLIALSLSGIVLWWRARIVAIRLRGPAKRLCFDAHSALGLYSLIFWMILGATGAIMTFEKVAEPVVYWVTRSRPVETPAFKATRSPGTKPLAVDTVLEIAQTALPGAQTTLVTLPRQSAGVITAFMKFPEDRTPAGRSRVQIDPYSGRVLWINSTRQVPLGTWFWTHYRSFPTGDQCGWPSRLLFCISSVLLAVQIYTGFTLWWRGWQSRKKGQA